MSPISSWHNYCNFFSPFGRTVLGWWDKGITRIKFLEYAGTSDFTWKIDLNSDNMKYVVMRMSKLGYSGSWWWTGRPGVLRFMGSQRVGHDWATELNWTEVGIKMWNSRHWKQNLHCLVNHQYKIKYVQKYSWIWGIAMWYGPNRSRIY